MSKRMQQRYQKKLLQFFNQNPGKAFKARTLSREFRIPNSDYRLFRQFLKTLAEEGLISRHKGNQYGKFVKPVLVRGKLHVKAQGYGFLIREDGGEDIFVSQKNMGSAMHGDTVLVQVWAHQTGKLPEGKVHDILVRRRECLVGIFMESHRYNYVIPDDFKITRDIYVSKPDSLTALPGQKVVVEITDWGDAGRMPEGRILEILGYPDDPGVDVLSVVRGFDLRDRFPESVESEAVSGPEHIPDDALTGRLDYRDRLVFTIDPEDARDFDDAVSLIRLRNGDYELGVHIADVSHFVPVGSAVDREAFSRGTSVYLVDRVIPMLPERLSNDLCSLKPGKDRLAFSVLMEMTPDAELVDYTFRESVIHSRFRLTYAQAQDMIETEAESGSGSQGADRPGSETDPFLVQTLKEMQALSIKLLSAWRKNGSIDFDAPEPRVILNEQGKPVALGIRPRLSSHRLIEAFMLLANRTVAEHISRLRQATGMKLPFIYRVHQKPSQEKLDKFAGFARAFGYLFDPGKKITPKKFQQFLDGITDARHKTVIDEVAVRTMMKASYTTANTGHFGLAFKDYTHFTSPIRRYPDLVVHRLLKSYSKPDPKPLSLIPTPSQIAAHATEREIAAQEAERESIRAKQVDFMAGHLGMEFEGIVSGVTSFGFFVEIPEFLVEGLVAARDLEDDYYLFDERQWQLRGERTHKIFRLGDSVKVQVSRVHRETRQIDFVLVRESGTASASRSRRGPGRRKKRRA
ncbi:ribonuclease R [bacterium]|nr:ribonuclease R [bacterium]